MIIKFRQEWVNDVNAMQQEVSRFLDYFSESKPPVVRFSRVMWEPSVDLYETPDDLIIIVELAGMKEDDFQMILDHDVFTIRGERRKLIPNNVTGVYHQMEIPSGPFEKSIILPVQVDSEKARASYDNGLVEVTLPKIKKEHVFKIEVKKK